MHNWEGVDFVREVIIGTVAVAVLRHGGQATNLNAVTLYQTMNKKVACIVIQHGVHFRRHV
jgi:hypothetical protein